VCEGCFQFVCSHPLHAHSSPLTCASASCTCAAASLTYPAAPPMCAAASPTCTALMCNISTWHAHSRPLYAHLADGGQAVVGDLTSTPTTRARTQLPHAHISAHQRLTHAHSCPMRTSTHISDLYTYAAALCARTWRMAGRWSLGTRQQWPGTSLPRGGSMR